MSELDDLLNTETTAGSQTPVTPAEGLTEGGQPPMSMEEINKVQEEVMLAKQGKGDKPSRERIKHAYESLRYRRSGATSQRGPAAATSKTKVTPMSSNDLDSLFGSGDLQG